jgi:hypothetical protein
MSNRRHSPDHGRPKSHSGKTYQSRHRDLSREPDQIKYNPRRNETDIFAEDQVGPCALCDPGWEDKPILNLEKHYRNYHKDEERANKVQQKYQEFQRDDRRYPRRFKDSEEGLQLEKEKQRLKEKKQRLEEDIATNKEELERKEADFQVKLNNTPGYGTIKHALKRARQVKTFD